MIRVDSHFHPNFNFLLPKRLLVRRARNIWRAFAHHKLDVVFVSEHSFKNPARSYRFLLAHKPAGCTTMLVPAVEALSAEGMELIVFSQDEHVYRQQDILTPFGLPMDEMLSRVQADPALHAILPHPFIPSGTGMMRHHTQEETCTCIRSAHCVEKYNASFIPLRRLLKRMGLTHLLHGLSGKLDDTSVCPGCMIDQGIAVFGGSDAHHWRDIGSHLLIHAERPATDKALFAEVTGGTHKRTMVWTRRHMPLLVAIAAETWTTLQEHTRKQLGIWRLDTTLLELTPPSAAA